MIVCLFWPAVKDIGTKQPVLCFSESMDHNSHLSLALNFPNVKTVVEKGRDCHLGRRGRLSLAEGRVFQIIFGD